MSLTRCALLLGVALAVAGCKPDLGTAPSLITGPRVIAVRQEPPEVAPGAKVMAEVFAVDSNGRLTPPADGVLWDLCTAHKSPSENNVVSAACLNASGREPVGSGISVGITIPVTACAVHGPDTPPTKPGEPPLRPRDPDVTGGYYQPVSVRLPASDDQAFGLERLRCNLPGASVDVAQDFAKRYQINKNPIIGVVTMDGTALMAAADAMTPPPATAVSAGTQVTLAITWPGEAREPFPVFDVSRRELVDHVEELVVSWFVTGGSLGRDRTGRSEAEPENTVANTWIAPIAPGPVHLWVVLRDNRGGTAVAEYRLEVH